MHQQNPKEKASTSWMPNVIYEAKAEEKDLEDWPDGQEGEKNDVVLMRPVNHMYSVCEYICNLIRISTTPQ